MKTLQMDEATARKIYPTAAPELKAILEESFGKQFFSQKMIDIINSFEDALLFKGKSASDVYGTNDTVDEVAYKKMKFIAKVLKGEWKPDYANENQKKWYAWFVWDSKKSAFVFANTRCRWTITYATVGSRLSFPDEETAKHFGTKFIGIINEFLTENPN